MPLGARCWTSLETRAWLGSPLRISTASKTIEAFRAYQLTNSFFRLYELYFNLAQQGLLDESIGASYEKVIRLLVRSESFPAWWKEAKEAEYQGAFVTHIDATVSKVWSTD